MNTHRLTASALSLLCLLTVEAVFAPHACAAAPKQVKALQLRQTHVYLGKVRVLLTPQAIRLDGLGKFHFTAISRAPKWQVTIFRTDDRISYTETFEQFCDQGLFSNLVLPQRDDKLLPGGSMFSQKVSGFPVKQKRLPSTMLRYLESTHYVEPRVSAFFHSVYRIPTEGHMPIEFELIMFGKDWLTNLSQEGQRRIFLATEKISLDNVPSTEFEVPRGLARAKSITRIIAGDVKKMEETGVDAIFKY